MTEEERALWTQQGNRRVRATVDSVGRVPMNTIQTIVLAIIWLLVIAFCIGAWWFFWLMLDAGVK